MSTEQLIATLQQIRDLVDAVLGAKAGMEKKRLRTQRTLTGAPASGKTSLPDRILGLRGEGFFQKPRTVDETHVKLQATYHCTRDRVVMALLRVHKKKQLRKTLKDGDGEQQTAYAW